MKSADNIGMKRLFSVLLLFVLLFSLSARPLYYAEEFYKLYYQKLYMYPIDYNEIIYWLEWALKAPFANPLYALAEIETEEEYERYQLLFKMHINLKLVEQYRFLAAEYQKQKAYFYNYAWREQNLESLKIAEDYFNAALYYWGEAKKYSEEAIKIRVFPEEIQEWSDENYRIETGDLDYAEIIAMDFERVEKVRNDFLAMDNN